MRIGRPAEALKNLLAKPAIDILLRKLLFHDRPNTKKLIYYENIYLKCPVPLIWHVTQAYTGPGFWNIPWCAKMAFFDFLLSGPGSIRGGPKMSRFCATLTARLKFGEKSGYSRYRIAPNRGANHRLSTTRSILFKYFFKS